MMAISDSKGRKFGPCGNCAFYNPHGTKATHATGRCHGAPPGREGFPIVREGEVGCAVFTPGPARTEAKPEPPASA